MGVWRSRKDYYLMIVNLNFKLDHYSLLAARAVVFQIIWIIFEDPKHLYLCLSGGYTHQNINKLSTIVIKDWNTCLEQSISSTEFVKMAQSYDFAPKLRDVLI